MATQGRVAERPATTRDTDRGTGGRPLGTRARTVFGPAALLAFVAGGYLMFVGWLEIGRWFGVEPEPGRKANGAAKIAAGAVVVTVPWLAAWWYTRAAAWRAAALTVAVLAALAGVVAWRLSG